MLCLSSLWPYPQTLELGWTGKACQVKRISLLSAIVNYGQKSFTTLAFGNISIEDS
jgi:hypothetical protein